MLFIDIHRNILFSIVEFTFFAQWWSRSNCVLYINPDDLEKVHNEHAIVMYACSAHLMIEQEISKEFFFLE